ncbi:hypothetical protein [Halomonas sp. E19]|uniref:hypothetical protein n=1 Tax=Halomonas sp. E19 TaxID=3397247 RepID=UPI004033303A
MSAKCHSLTGVWRAGLTICLLWLGLLLPLVALSEEVLPDPQAVEARLAELRGEEGETPSAAQQRDIEALEATLAALERLEAVNERLAALEQRLEDAPAELLRLEREMLQEEEASMARSIADLDGLPLDELEYRQQEAVFDLQQLQDRLAEVNAQLLSAQTLPERVQQAIGEAMQNAERSRRALDTLEAQG